MYFCSQILDKIHIFSSQIANNMISRTEETEAANVAFGLILPDCRASHEARGLKEIYIDTRIDFCVSFSFLLPEKHIFAFPVLFF